MDTRGPDTTNVLYFIAGVVLTGVIAIMFAWADSSQERKPMSLYLDIIDADFSLDRLASLDAEIAELQLEVNEQNHILQFLYGKKYAWQREARQLIGVE